MGTLATMAAARLPASGILRRSTKQATFGLRKQNGSSRHLARSTPWRNSNDERKTPEGNQNPGELPKFSMKDLQASPAVKVVVYSMIGIIATAETYTYGLWAYHRWFKTSDEPEAES